MNWNCTTGDASVSLDFSSSGGGKVTACGTEVLQVPSQQMPTVSLAAPSLLAAATNFTVLMVDRDAPNATSPIRSPLRHMLLTGIPRAAMRAGVSSPAVAARSPQAYAGPQPPPGSLCHRYYVQIYAETEGVAPLSLPANSSRFSWDFTQWAQDSGLSLVGGTYFRTQNASARTTDCDGAPLPGRAPATSALSPAALAAAIAAPLLALLACVVWRMHRGRAAAQFPAAEAQGSSAPYAALDKANPLAKPVRGWEEGAQS
jgi:hypothetical protein